MKALVLYLSVIPIAAYIAYAFFAMYRHRSTWERDSERAPRQAPHASIGGSSIHGVRERSVSAPDTQPLFNIRDLTYSELGPGSWQLKPRVLLLNSTAREILLDDLHTIIYVQIVSVPPLLTISYHGTSVILQDNRLLKEENRPYSLEAGDGFEMDILIEATRLEGAPSYYPVRPKKGACCFVLGLIADYSYPQPGDDELGTVTTDSLCMFLCRSAEDEPEFLKIDSRTLRTIRWPLRGYEELDSLEDILNRHRRYRPKRRLHS